MLIFAARPKAKKTPKAKRVQTKKVAKPKATATRKKASKPPARPKAKPKSSGHKAGVFRNKMAHLYNKNASMRKT